MRIAAIADVHGNLGALDGVLTDIATRKVDLVVNLGDCLSGPLLPAESADRLIPLALPTIRGNHERQLLTLHSEQMGPSDRYTASRIKQEHLQWMADLPETSSPVDGVLLVHGTPQSDADYFLETVDEGELRPASIDEVERRAGPTPARLILCGHSHLQRSIKLRDGRMVVNPGSVGLQAYDAVHPQPHKVESGSPHARYAIVQKRNHQWSVELIAIVYDWERMAQLAQQQGRADWATALRTGRL